VLAEHPRGAWRHIGVQDDAVMAEIETLKREFDAAVGACRRASRARSKSCSAATSCRPA
jgi:hypothetical protein